MQKLSELIFKDKNLQTVQEIYEKYPFRNLKGEQKITRIAPSPTGAIHIGTLYMALVCERVAHQSNGVFFLRIEDTDEKREIVGMAEKIPAILKKYGILFDEGYSADGKSIGKYGPYLQSERRSIYMAFIEDMVKNGLAYPCFCTEEELEMIVKQQKMQNCQRLGYYGSWAKYRNYPAEEAIKRIENGEEYVIRYKSSGDFNKKIAINDMLKGVVEFPENDLDIVILKKNNLPTYHFAHVIDDFLMGTNLVLRADEWLPSLPLHIQLFRTMGWKAPQYGHVSPILKLENGGKRKLSKRKDPEANVEYFEELGYPLESVIEYMLNLANSNFEDWRKQNENLDYREFQFSIKKMNTSGALFDFVKLSSISREIIGKMSNRQIYDLVVEWAKKFDSSLYSLMAEEREQVLRILNIERENTGKVRKDIEKWSDIKREIGYFFNMDYVEAEKLLKGFNKDDIKAILTFFIENYDEKDSNDEWFLKMKTIAEKLNFATNLKEYKQNPSSFKGSVSDVARILRVAITGREQSPNLWEVMKILTSKVCVERLRRFL